ncbi:N5-glutamine S-adenosyl-L-methionine-dependent methyltransferase [bacterium BMS3Abin04]|nr:N5-glutamine S-adenosyl-L-methionine-dependent methyltransferase [bacterium BMS3Abin04]
MKNDIKIDYKKHWNEIYSKNDIKKLGWYEESAKPSLDLIQKCNLNKDAIILDVGSGATTLILELVNNCYKNIIATDISEAALTIAQNNLRDEEKELVKWIVDDITDPEYIKEIGAIDLWHDRTVLHFLTEEKQKEGYFSTLKHLVKIGGFVIIAVFALGGAQKCSGLDIVNYNHKMVSNFLGDNFKLLHYFPYLYIQPSGGERPYVYTLFQRII